MNKPERSIPRAALVALAAILSACGATSTPADGGNNNPDAATGGDASGGGDGGTSTDAGQAVTYWKDIAPIVNGHCTTCHTQGGLGPMPLTTYDEARPVAALMAAETGAKRMPPWPPDTTNCRALKDPRGLTDAEIALVAQWAQDGAPEGNPADYVAPPPPNTGMTPLPPTGDLYVQPDADYLPNQAVHDDYHCFVVDPNLTTQQDVVGFRVTPGNQRVVHHVILFEVRQEALTQLQALDDAEPGPGYTCFGGVGIDPVYRQADPASGDLIDFNLQWVGSWAPGGEPGYFPANTGIRLKAGSRLVMQVHYNIQNDTLNMTDRTRVDLYFQPGGVPSQAVWVPYAQSNFLVPAGAGPTDPAATATISTPQQYPLRVFGVGPHMHIRGRSIRVDVDHADGTSNCLINIPNWNFHWQRSYWFSSPFRPQTSSTNQDSVRLTCTWDNTAANQPVVDGVQQPPHDLHWGEGTDQEMCLNLFYTAL